MNHAKLLGSAALLVLLLSSTGCLARPPSQPQGSGGAGGPEADVWKRAEKRISGNECPKTSPWPCKNGQCLSFSFICDGRKDCEDGYDEDRALCTAKDRPASIILKMFIMRFHNWLIPNVLGQGSPDQLSKLLTEERNVADYAKKVGLTEQEKQTLIRTMEFAREGRVLDLIMEGMPEEAYREAYALFGRLVESGFLGVDAM